MKKLATVLALTAIVANMGLATVFAQQTQAPEGSQTIGCNGSGTITIGSLASQTFTSKTTAFTGDTNADITGENFHPAVTDTRGYDPTANQDCSTLGDGHAFTLDIQSDGLIKDGGTAVNTVCRDNQGGQLLCTVVAESLDSPTLHLTLGTAASNSNLSADANFVPSTFSTVANAHASTGDITTGKVLVDFDESFSGTLTTLLMNSDLQVAHDTITYGAGSSTYLQAGNPIPAGVYRGAITVTLGSV